MTMLHEILIVGIIALSLAYSFLKFTEYAYKQKKK